MKCVICRSGTTDMGVTTVTLERDQLTLVMKKVPAMICSNCGEAYVNGKIGSQILEIAEQIALTGTEIEVRQYKAA